MYDNCQTKLCTHSTMKCVLNECFVQVIVVLLLSFSDHMFKVQQYARFLTYHKILLSFNEYDGKHLPSISLIRHVIMLLRKSAIEGQQYSNSEFIYSITVISEIMNVVSNYVIYIIYNIIFYIYCLSSKHQTNKLSFWGVVIVKIY